MDVLLHLKTLLLILLATEGACQLTCSAPKGSNCIPIGRPTQSCITEAKDGSRLTWFDMEENCANDTGRLVWLKDNFTSEHLVNTLKMLSRSNYTVIGLLQSMKGDDLTFWRNPSGNDTITCASKDTNICLSPPTTHKHCNTIGCCWVNGKCQYPEYQRLAENNGSTAVVTGSVTGRSCVGLQKNGVNWNLTTYDCSMSAVSGTSYVCEYKCAKDWPNIPKRNVTWIRTTSFGVPGSSTFTIKSGSPSSGYNSENIMTTNAPPNSSVDPGSSTSTIKSGNGRNKAGNIFEKQVVLMTYIALVFLIDSMELFIL